MKVATSDPRWRAVWMAVHPDDAVPESYDLDTIPDPDFMHGRGWTGPKVYAWDGNAVCWEHPERYPEPCDRDRDGCYLAPTTGSRERRKAVQP